MSCIPIPMDLHLHTTNSPDGTNTAAELVARANELQIPTIAFTDHCEINEYFSKGYVTSVPSAFAAAQQAKTLGRPVEVLCGIEIGQPYENYALTDRILSAQAYDFVLVSLHKLPNTKEFYYLSADRESADYLLDRYFSTMLEVVRWGNFDAVAHLTYPLRYISGTFGLSADLSLHREKLDAVLAQLAQQHKALEINTCGYRNSSGTCDPALPVLRRFRELGGTMVTIGSDAHSVSALGSGIAQGMEVARAAGFETLTVFRNRRPYPIAF